MCGNEMRFEVLAAVNIETTVFWDVTPCNLVAVHQRLGTLGRDGVDCPENGGSRFL
jgi:hypothetical protein